MTLIRRIPRALRSRIQSAPLLNRAALDEAARDRAGGHPLARDPREHLEAALEWLVRAHDATPDGGVSRAYSVAWHPYFESKGWQASYPETTGYIIPTLFEMAERLRRPDLRERAARMADWEIEVQLGSGAVQGGIIGEQDPPTPAVFNTGQVMLGWARAHRETGRAEYLEAARRAADYLLTTQDEDGAFRRAQSQFARADTTTYNTRVAWAMCEVAELTGDRRYREAGDSNVRYAVSRQLENGWFEANCLTDPDRPLLHTIAYAARGVLEVGLALDRDDYVRAARRTADALALRQRRDGGLGARFARDWTEQADWDCLTGDAQTAIIWSKIARAAGDRELAERARAICRFVMRSQNRESDDPGLAGGIKGSFPFDGDYGRFELLNWAAKFFIDSVVLAFPESFDAGEQ